MRRGLLIPAGQHQIKSRTPSIPSREVESILRESCGDGSNDLKCPEEASVVANSSSSSAASKYQTNSNAKVQASQG